ncbi:hypothetical protein CEJ86_00675 [Sinorhizobium meliloti]|uniref:Uncharacterized protein n=1 Tax=Rhizobium meliloti TaxID=382 RepID=A0A2J0Z8C0_RHIML|nr:hypothetical protein CEJ86_00675 [Sinorhizobium meliloti]
MAGPQWRLDHDALRSGRPKSMNVIDCKKSGMRAAHSFPHSALRATRRRLFDLLIPVLVTGIQPDQVLGLKERFPRRRRGAAGSL